MRVLVLGAGALGGYFGAMLLRGGADVAFLVRPKRAAQVAERGLVIKEPAGDIVTPVKTLAAAGVDGRYDLVFLACKAYDLDSAIEAIAPAVGADSAIFPVLNGVRHIDRLVEHFGAAPVLGGYILIRAELTPEGEIVRPPGVGVEDIAFGELTGETSRRCGAICAALAAGGLSSRISDHILEDVGKVLRLYHQCRDLDADPRAGRRDRGGPGWSGFRRRDLRRMCPDHGGGRLPATGRN